MSFRKEYRYASTPFDALVPGIADDPRTVTDKIRAAYHDNNTDMLAIIITVKRARGVSVDLVMTDNPDPSKTFPYALEMFEPKFAQSAPKSLPQFIEKGAGRSVGIECGFYLNRADFEREHDAFTPFEKIISESQLWPV